MLNYFPRFAVAFLIITATTGCPTMQINKVAAWEKEILKTDKEFSEQSANEGMKRAFIEYMDDNGILLRPNHLPIVGADAIKYLSETNDTSYKLTWQPSNVHVGASGDLGYTYGIYTLQLHDTILSGTYVSIWKKQKDNKWKFVLDTGNAGINKPDERR
jgi:ketosteroid isomerase-like protein